MITFLESSVFESPAQTLVNTVNVVGVMGKGIAKEFKSRYPAMFKEYRHLCDSRDLKVGNLHLWRDKTRWVLNFPTKTTWKLPSKMEYVEVGLQKFVSTYKDLGITSISFPPLGCGNGNLDWQAVKPLMVDYLSKIDIPVYIHDVQVGANFEPEHRSIARTPDDFEEFTQDIEKVAKGRSFATSRASNFRAEVDDDNSIIVVHSSGKRERIDHDLIEASWVRLRERLLSYEGFSDDKSRRLKSYLFPILQELPYVRMVKIKSGANRADALFIDRDQYSPVASAENVSQGWLFQ
ncbi:macro domain-containing protein [Shinella yambaruensis]|uniref:Macro domain-containing protein n=1 Tax=Shinella yambaruensis TaxID=415996 RepID=A0ABQ5ZEA8_9HYPH|nr:macro domain-containing protein [Shinella yambaruensis]MCJ8028253.1 macro domain-containing protein [Shinella yambaruensis]MCU7980265.1 macro domain-containing protein [Shinella yambaruensis]GLR49218.1 hypothetical protein GCM10007923_04230 [Shinella yambaruensis]